jgi:hypothetical protein
MVPYRNSIENIPIILDNETEEEFSMVPLCNSVENIPVIDETEEESSMVPGNSIENIQIIPENNDKTEDRSIVRNINFSIEQRVFLISQYYKHKSFKIVKENFQKKYDQTPPNKSTISRLLKKFRITGSVHDGLRSGRHLNKRTKEILREIQSIIEDDPTLSINRVAAIAQVSYSTARKILRDDLKLFPYKVQRLQELKSEDYLIRQEYCLQMLIRSENEGVEFLNNIYFSDESWFHLSGYINKQNSRM